MFAAASRGIAGLALASLLWPSWALGASTTVSAQICPQSFAPTTLSTTEPNPTTNASADMTGTTEPGATVNLTVNGVTRASLAADSGGNFGATVPLIIGDNTIVASADNGTFCGQSSSSPPVLLHRNQVPPPAPVISAPSSGLVTTSSSITVSGSAEADSTLSVFVDGGTSATLTVGSDGIYSVSVPLTLGSNSIQAQAANPAGSGPLSSAVLVTRKAPPPPASPPPPSPPPTSPVTPSITSPADGASTTGTSIMVDISGPAGATAQVYDNGTLVGSLDLASDGTGALLIPLILGPNALIVRTGNLSSQVINITRVSTGGAPQITTPRDGASTTGASINVAGRAGPGALVTIYVGSRQAATVTADDTGAFGATVGLSPGLNLIYVQAIGPGGTVLRSQAVQVERQVEGFGAGAAGGAKSGLTALLSIPAALIILTVQGIAAAVRAVAASPAGSALVLAFAVILSTASRGYIGLELLLTLPGLLRLLIPRGRDALSGRVIDSVTGRPLALVKITAGTTRPVHTITRPDGSFSLPVFADQVHVMASRPGFQPWTSGNPAGSGNNLVVTLEPDAAALSPIGIIIDFLMGAAAWLTMLFAGLLGAYLVLHSPSLTTAVAAIISIGTVVVNLALLATRPHYHWGRLLDGFGSSIPGADVSLLDPSGKAVSTYRTDKSGRYTLFGEPGHYQLNVKHGALAVHEEPVTVRRHRAYLGFRLILPHP